MKIKLITIFSMLTLMSITQAYSKEILSFFFISNDTDKRIEVSVGAFPTIDRTIEPNSRATFVGDGPNIRIKKVS